MEGLGKELARTAGRRAKVAGGSGREGSLQGRGKDAVALRESSSQLTALAIASYS